MWITVQQNLYKVLLNVYMYVSMNSENNISRFYMCAHVLIIMEWVRVDRVKGYLFFISRCRQFSEIT